MNKHMKELRKSIDSCEDLATAQQLLETCWRQISGEGFLVEIETYTEGIYDDTPSFRDPYYDWVFETAQDANKYIENVYDPLLGHGKQTLVVTERKQHAQDYDRRPNYWY